MTTRLVLLALLATAIVAGYRSMVFVDETETVIVTEFGRMIDVVEQSGFRWKRPYQSVIRIDRRLQIYDPRPSEFLAAEKKNVDLDVFACWRVDDPMRFLETVNSPAGAEIRMHDLIWSDLAAEIGRNPLDALVSTDPETQKLEELLAQVTTRCAKTAQQDYGIEIVDIRLKRISLPSQVRQSVFQRMRSERTRIADQYRAEGEEEARKIRAEADKSREIQTAQASAQANEILGPAEAKAIRIYAEAHAADPEFYRLLRTLEAYEKFLDDKTTILMSSDSEVLRYLSAPGDPRKLSANERE